MILTTKEICAVCKRLSYPVRCGQEENFSCTMSGLLKEVLQAEHEATRKEAAKWMAKPCPHYPLYRRTRFECQDCMSEFKKSLKKGEMP